MRGGTHIPTAHPHPEEEVGCCGVHAGLLEALGPLKVTHLTPAAFSPAPGDPHFLHQPPCLQGAPIGHMRCF